MRRERKFLILVRQLRHEITDLGFAWNQYIKWEILGRDDARKFISSIGIGLCVSVFISLISWIKNSVYAQGSVSLNPDSGASLYYCTFSWMFSGGLVSTLVGFVRARYKMCKRMFDFIMSGLGLVLLSPLFLLIAVLIKIDSLGGVFFRQMRVGENGKFFSVYKFRTMRENAEIDTGPVWADDDDPRVTKLGRFLRNSHLDEFPQLINVFRGEMSLIGPRPERPELQEKICCYVPKFKNRLCIKPGITGLAQSRYQYGATIKDAQRKLKYDLIYTRRMCWTLDFLIMWWTVGRVLTGEGAR